MSFAGFGYVFGQALERIIGDIILAFGVTMLTMFGLVFLGAYVARRRKARRDAASAAADTQSNRAE